ncbi:MAG: hypothetical protein IT385_17560 [Deltaproteobacteria bacterium]|nr:hypothetical protein [Deltaproteobacteria bacterium]
MSEPPRGVTLPAGETGSAFFHRLLSEAVSRFPAALSQARFPADARAFKKDYARALVRFEAARVASPERVDIARHLVTGLHAGLGFTRDGGRLPLAEHLATRAPDPRMTTVDGAGGRPGLVPSVTSGGAAYDRRSIVSLAEDLRRQHHMTDAALAALRWIVERAEADGGLIDLRGEHFALLGAGAELAPTAMLLRAGATILWIDRVGPAERLSPDDLQASAGRLVTAEGASDLLADPLAVAAAIARFAERAERPVHVGLFAYAPGQGRELRLAAGMDAIVRSLDPGLVGSVSMFVSPTIPAEVQSEDHARASARAAAPAVWQRALERVRAIRGPGHHQSGGSPIAHAVVALQGPTYQAAQYLAKVLSAEVYATSGLGLGGASSPVRVSANIAGITATRSLVHPLFQAGFLGAPSFGIRIFEPTTTRSLASLLVLHDLLNPAAPSAPGASFATPDERVRALASRQLHGGVYNLPWILDDTIRAAAVIGLTKKPRLVLALARRSR